MSKDISTPKRSDMALALEFIQQVPYAGPVGLTREIRDTLLAMDEPERLIRGLFHLLSEGVLAEAERDLAQTVEIASCAIKSGRRDTARDWAKELVAQGVCKLVLGEHCEQISAASWRIYCAFQGAL